MTLPVIKMPIPRVGKNAAATAVLPQMQALQYVGLKMALGVLMKQSRNQAISTGDYRYRP